MDIWERIPFRYATIVPDEEEGTRGHVLRCGSPAGFRPDEHDGSARTRLRIEALVRVHVGGQVAEQILRGRKSWNQGSQSDQWDAVNLLMYLTRNGDGEDVLAARLHLLILETRDILRRPWNWAKVEAVAAALLKDKTLPAREVRRIAKEASEALYAATVAA
jgi:hypothetical protein